jgi:hypothetical protein
MLALYDRRDPVVHLRVLLHAQAVIITNFATAIVIALAAAMKA